jgi:hypothetical protein
MNQRIYLERITKNIKPFTLYPNGGFNPNAIHLLFNQPINTTNLDWAPIKFNANISELCHFHSYNAYWNNLPSDEFYMKLKEQFRDAREELARFVRHPNWIAKCAKRMNMDESDYIDLLHNCNVI